MTEPDGTRVCEQCHDRRVDEAHARYVARFFGGSEPFTVAEHSHQQEDGR